MAGNQKSVFIRFNMDDEADRELYLKLAEAAGNAVSLTAYVKRALGEHFKLDVKIADRQEFHSQMLAAVREEMQSQGMKMVGAILAGIGAAGVRIQRTEDICEAASLPEVCEELPEGLQGILDFIG